MKSRFVLLGLIVCLIYSTNVQAKFREGDKDFSVGASGFSDKKFEDNSSGVDFSLGYFLKDQWEIAFREGIDLSGTNNYSSRVALDHYWGSEAVRPFIGANIGYVSGDDISDTWEAAPEGGLKWFINDTAYIFGMAEYQFFFDDSNGGDDDFNDGRFVYSAGIGFRF